MLLQIDSNLDEYIRTIPSRYRQARRVRIEGLKWSKPFYLIGGVGAGKTHAVYGLKIDQVMRVLSKMKADGCDSARIAAIQIVNIVDLSRDLRTRSFEARDELVDDLKEMPFLVLNDLGAEYSTDYTEAILYEVIEARYRNERYTGFASNHSISELPYDDRIKSRIVGLVGNNIARLEGKDRRVA